MCALYEYFCISLCLKTNYYKTSGSTCSVGSRSEITVSVAAAMIIKFLSIFSQQNHKVLQTLKQNEKKSNATLEKAKMTLLMWRIKSRFMCEWCFNLEPDLLRIQTQHSWTGCQCLVLTRSKVFWVNLWSLRRQQRGFWKRHVNRKLQ